MLSGTIVSRELESIILKVGGVGYSLAVPARDASQMLEGEEVTLYVAENIREDAYDLYGFRSLDERQIYYRLISVNGVGAKMGHGVLSVYDAGTLAELIDTEDIVRLSQVSGVGKKTAQRIILELKGKLVATDGGGNAAQVNDPAMQALVQLGFSREQAVQVLRGINVGLDTSERVRQALKELGR